MKLLRRAGVVLVIAVAVGALSVFLSPAPVDDTSAKEGARVFCTAPAQRSGLLDAAATLRVTIPLSQLVDGQGQEFMRVCAALTAAARIPLQPPAAAPVGPVKTVLLALLPVVAGAALAWFTGFWRDTRTQSLLLADALQAAARRFRNAVHVEQEKWLGPETGVVPLDPAVLAARDELAGQLRKIGIFATEQAPSGPITG
jgi:hypothetical protein